MKDERPARLTRRRFLQLAAVTAAALGLGAVPAAEGEPAPDTLLGVPIEWTNFDEPETVLIGPVPSELLDDTQFDLQAYIEAEMCTGMRAEMRAIALEIDREFMEGAGTGAVLGVLKV